MSVHVTFYVAVPDVEAALVEGEGLGGIQLGRPHTMLDRVEVGAFCDGVAQPRTGVAQL